MKLCEFTGIIISKKTTSESFCNSEPRANSLLMHQKAHRKYNEDDMFVCYLNSYSS